jgi:hypothetical protein
LAASFISIRAGLNETASRALPGMYRLSIAIIALSFALLIGAFVLTVFTF